MKRNLIPLLALVLYGCVNPSALDEMDVDYVKNIPVTANTPNAFSYVVMADGFTHQVNSPLNFDTASFVTAIVVGDYSQGSLSLVVYNEDSSQSYSQLVTSSVVFTDFPAFHAASLELKLQGFSGSVDLAVTVGY